MLNPGTAEGLSWYAIHTHPKQEGRAERNLRAWSVETFAPQHKQSYLNRGAIQAGLIKPLFPRYIFARFVASELLHKVRFTRGVHSVVSSGYNPLLVDDEIITIIQSRRSADGLIRMGNEFKTGDQVMIRDGHFKGFTGIFERTSNDAERVMIMLKTVNYQSHIVIEKEYLRKVSAFRSGA